MASSAAAPSADRAFDLLVVLCRALLNVSSDAPLLPSSTVARTTMLPSFVQAVAPLRLLAFPPPPPLRASLRTLISGWAPSAYRQLEEALASEMGSWSQLQLAGQRFHAASLLVEALSSCLEGRGCDWRRGGWCEAGPRLLSRDELIALSHAQVGRLRQGFPDVPLAEVTITLMRHKWELSAAAVALAAPDALLASALVAEREAVVAATDGVAVALGDESEMASCQVCEPAEDTCGICFDTFVPPLLHALHCGHRFCAECWGGLLHTALERGPACLQDTCPPARLQGPHRWRAMARPLTTTGSGRF